VAPAVESELRGLGLTVRRVDTTHLEHARELGLEAAQAGETVVALSGDGMLGVLADALRTVPGALLGVLPGGRGNDFARVLGIPEDAIAACATIAAGVARTVDLGLVTSAQSDDDGLGEGDGGWDVGASGAGEGAPPGQAFVGIASCGFDSDANRIANEAPAWLGGLVYAYGALRALLSWRAARFEIELRPQGERHTFSGFTVAAANSKAYGGGMYMAPDALLDDGLLEIVVVEKVGKLRFVANLPKVFAGKHVRGPSVRVFRAAEITLDADRPFTMYADGDPIGELPLRVSALAGAVRMLVPPAGAVEKAFGARTSAS
ncbi:MAG TPA: YegS/Rv2252/BmrU family lipid kinase, partial [Solirubrobacteraceae bacterium]|nr:YegS/Rv2252/BmrU family lipid kinase [Solirubrobacteraceae bacterium]